MKRSAEELLLLSCVGGGPMSRLCRALSPAGIHGQVVSAFSPERWRRLMANGRVGRAVARAGAWGAYPLYATLRCAIERPDWVVPTTNPFFLPLVLVATRPLHGARVAALVYDLYPDAVEAVRRARQSSLLSRAGEAANRYWFAGADALVFIGEGMAEHARARYGEPRRWTVLETGADARELSHPKRDGGPDDWERWLGDAVAVSYVGNLGLVHDWQTVADALPIPPSDGLQTRVLVAASGPGDAWLRQRWASHTDDARFIGPLPDRQWARLLARTDIALVTLKHEAARTSIPSKTFSAMAAGCAIVAVAPPDSDLARLLRRHDCGQVVEPGDVEGLARAVVTLASDPAQLRAKQDHARRAVAAHYDMQVLATRWTTFLRGITDDPAQIAGESKP